MQQDRAAQESAAPREDLPDETVAASQEAELVVDDGTTPDDEALSQRLARAETEAREHYELFLRARAEAENVRRRAETDTGNARKYAVERFATDLLEVRDNLERSLTVENASIESLTEGVELTLRQLTAVFERHGVREVAPQPGERFDPNLHQAVSMVPADVPPNSVASVLQKGYLLEDRVIRPAMVMVSGPG